MKELQELVVECPGIEGAVTCVIVLLIALVFVLGFVEQLERQMRALERRERTFDDSNEDEETRR